MLVDITSGGSGRLVFFKMASQDTDVVVNITSGIEWCFLRQLGSFWRLKPPWMWDVDMDGGCGWRREYV